MLNLYRKKQSNFQNSNVEDEPDCRIIGITWNSTSVLAGYFGCLLCCCTFYISLQALSAIWKIFSNYICKTAMLKKIPLPKHIVCEVLVLVLVYVIVFHMHFLIFSNTKNAIDVVPLGTCSWIKKQYSIWVFITYLYLIVSIRILSVFQVTCVDRLTAKNVNCACWRMRTLLFVYQRRSYTEIGENFF